MPPTVKHTPDPVAWDARAAGHGTLAQRGMGRSRGGLTIAWQVIACNHREGTKIHALVDAMGLPIALKLTEGRAHDGRSAVDMFDTLQAGNILLTDRAYDANALRERLAERGV